MMINPSIATAFNAVFLFILLMLLMIFNLVYNLYEFYGYFIIFTVRCLLAKRGKIISNKLKPKCGP